MSSTSIQTTIALVLFVMIVLIIAGLYQSPASTLVAGENNVASDGVVVIGNGTNVPTLSPTTVPAINVTVNANANGINTSGTVSASSQSAPAPVGGQTTYRLHTVQTGEGLWRISQRYGTTIDAILAINPEISDPNVISPGQQIRIP